MNAWLANWVLISQAAKLAKEDNNIIRPVGPEQSHDSHKWQAIRAFIANLDLTSTQLIMQSLTLVYLKVVFCPCYYQHTKQLV